MWTAYDDVTSMCNRQVMRSVEEAQTLATSRHGKATAKYNFTGQTDLELSFRKVSLSYTIQYYTVH